MTATNESILKTDLRGRRRFTPQQKKDMVDAYLTSGLSTPRFAKLHGINYQTLIYWVKKSGANGPPKTLKPSDSLQSPFFSLVAAEIVHSSSSITSDAIEMLLPGGVRFLIASPNQIQLGVAILRELNHSSAC